MASMGPFPNERIGRDIDDLPIWADWNSYPCEWNEFYCSRSWNIAPISFPKIPVSPPASPHAKKETVTKRRSKTSTAKRRSSTESINSEKSRKSRNGSIIKTKKKKKGSSKNEKVSKPKSEKKKKKKSKKDRKNSMPSRRYSYGTSSSANHESSTEFTDSGSFLSPRSSTEFHISSFQSPLSGESKKSASFSGLSPGFSPSMRSLGSCSSIMGCDLPDDVIDYIDDLELEELEQTPPQPQLELPLQAEETESPPKKTKTKKKKQKAKDQKQRKSPHKAKVTEKKPSPAISPKNKAITMETLPEEVLVTTKQSQSLGLGRGQSPKRTHRFSKLMVVADGSIRRAVDRNKGSFWEQSVKRTSESVKRRGSVRKSIHEALGEIAGIQEALDLFDEDDAKLEWESKTAERSVSTEITDPWHNSWSMSSDSFHDNSDRAFKNPLLLSKSPEVEQIKRVTPF
mmetsp:Transcript_4670/g.11047  ORF Transcript_4670/g.11047 Transcript_4670/m.11047 type:complete len:456 (-) Transcript_4670:1126-2493(-)